MSKIVDTLETGGVASFLPSRPLSIKIISFRYLLMGFVKLQDSIVLAAVWFLLAFGIWGRRNIARISAIAMEVGVSLLLYGMVLMSSRTAYLDGVNAKLRDLFEQQQLAEKGFELQNILISREMTLRLLIPTTVLAGISVVVICYLVKHRSVFIKGKKFR